MKMKIKLKISRKDIFVLIFIGAAFSLFLMSTLEDGRLDKNVFGAEKTAIRGIYIGDIPIWVEVANTVEKRKTGLSGRKNLSEDRGMLFAFDKPDKHGIWMKDMNFSIDILWIDENYKIIDIKKQAESESFPEIFHPSENATYVIEVMAGFVEMHNINIGDRVILQIL
jgi:hypothetical protein